MKTNLTVEESARLIELGVDPKLASTTCINFNGTYAYVSGEESGTVRDCVNGQFYTEECSCYTLIDILSILPKEIKNERCGFACLCMDYDQSNQWTVFYRGIAFCIASHELVDALNQLLIWCIKNNFINLK